MHPKEVVKANLEISPSERDMKDSVLFEFAKSPAWPERCFLNIFSLFLKYLKLHIKKIFSFFVLKIDKTKIETPTNH